MRACGSEGATQSNSKSGSPSDDGGGRRRSQRLLEPLRGLVEASQLRARPPRQRVGERFADALRQQDGTDRAGNGGQDRLPVRSDRSPPAPPVPPPPPGTHRRSCRRPGPTILRGAARAPRIPSSGSGIDPRAGDHAQAGPQIEMGGQDWHRRSGASTPPPAPRPSPPLPRDSVCSVIDARLASSRGRIVLAGRRPRHPAAPAAALPSLNSWSSSFLNHSTPRRSRKRRCSASHHLAAHGADRSRAREGPRRRRSNRAPRCLR